MNDILSIIAIPKFLVVSKEIRTQIFQSNHAIKPIFLAFLKFDDIENIKKMKFPAGKQFRYACEYKKFRTFKYLVKTYKNEIINENYKINNLKTKYTHYYVRHLHNIKIV
jgi:hypothetical protein